MHIHAIELQFAADGLTDDLFERALASVDDSSRARIRKFFRREDAWRCLVGRILPRYLLLKRGVALSAIDIAYTQSGKPYIARPNSPLKFNISHDSSFVVMAHADDAEDIGADVMRCALPRGETLRSFTRVLDDQLTTLEKRAVTDSASSDAGVHHLFQLWTLKEAYTKTLGLGLGFDFSRIEYDVGAARVRVDGGAPAEGDAWEFTETAFTASGEPYVCVVARRGVPTPLRDDSGALVQRQEPDEGWVTRMDAVSFLETFLSLVRENESR
ncbi:4'-phosphopantetheinyl transferase [Exidia glandulosa HHB12029]|uniref:holo-[acyl-carrier-protein] synthase n=1 Tax=Exidia glandulosa HHB12029 TaxID=1314781 RepID=A0A165QQT9_EXIGL|nr:4'-phosphopantetheinyl transferase [Exidia glandulosa HHB12029]